MQFQSTAEDSFNLNVHLSHVKASGLDISSELESQINLIALENGTRPYLKGIVTSKYSLLNLKPVDEFRGHFEIKNDRLYLNGVAWGNIICDGFINLMTPYDTDLTFRLDDIRLSDIFVLLGCSLDEADVSGFVSGRLKASGFLDRLMLRGRFTVDDGHIQDLEYEAIWFNFEGLFPRIQLVDSRLTESSGMSFNLNGNLELTRQCNILSDIGSFKVTPLIDETSLEREWTIKRSQDDKSSRATELKYRLKKSNAIGIAPDEASDILGIENSIKF